jgi:hypothetical protein
MDENLDAKKCPRAYRELDAHIRRMIDAEWHVTFVDLGIRARSDSDLPIEPYDTRCLPAILSWCKEFRVLMLEVMTPYALCYRDDKTPASLTDDEREAFCACRYKLFPLFDGMWRVQADTEAQLNYADQQKHGIHDALDELYARVQPKRCKELCQQISDWALLEGTERFINKRVTKLCERVNQRCETCNKRAPRYIASCCKKVYYCDRKCQSDDYLRHKQRCTAAAAAADKNVCE